MLTSDFDVMAFREAFESAKRFFAAPAWKGFVLGLAEPWASATPDRLDALIRNSTIPAHHIVGTAAMSPPGADHGVVDPDLRLKHASGLRVVDASVMVSTNAFLFFPV
jgi:choline dehydrogenase